MPTEDSGVALDEATGEDVIDEDDSGALETGLELTTGADEVPTELGADDVPTEYGAEELAAMTELGVAVSDEELNQL